MNKKNILLTAMFLSIAGILFAGYLTINKLVLGVCSFGESCPILFGYPVCIYGLIIFSTVFITTVSLMLTNKDPLANRMLLYASTLGVVFSGYYALQEVFNPICGSNCVYKMGLPTCVYGFIVFIAVFVCMLAYRKSSSGKK